MKDLFLLLFGSSQALFFFRQEFDFCVIFFWFQELENMADPMRKEVSLVRKKIDSVNKELKPLGATVQKKVKHISQ